MALIDEELKAFLESDVAVAAGTRDRQLVPQAVRGWGPRVAAEGDAMELFIDRAFGGKALDNLRDNGQIAVTFAEPISHRSVQLKGVVSEIAEVAPSDWPWIDRHRRLFTSVLHRIGYSEVFTNGLWAGDLVRVQFKVEQAFNQTPGPGAGRSL